MATTRIMPLHIKAFRYAIMLQRFGRHTPLPTLYYYYMQL